MPDTQKPQPPKSKCPLQGPEANCVNLTFIYTLVLNFLGKRKTDGQGRPEKVLQQVLQGMLLMLPMRQAAKRVVMYRKFARKVGWGKHKKLGYKICERILKIPIKNTSKNAPKILNTFKSRRRVHPCNPEQCIDSCRNVASAPKNMKKSSSCPVYVRGELFFPQNKKLQTNQKPKQKCIWFIVILRARICNK